MKRPAEELSAPDKRPAHRKILELANASAKLKIDLAGGSLAAFQLATLDSVNPLCWDSAVHDGADPSSTSPRPVGHFLCVDRWGPPTVEEEANGMGYHGEAISTNWEVLEQKDGMKNTAVLKTVLPIAGLEVKRDVSLCGESAVVVVREQVTNINKLGRIYNMVQHPSIAAPFLDNDTLIDCNGKRGFAQGPNRTNSFSPEIHPLRETSFEFPETINRAGAKANARHMTGGDDDVQSYEVEPDSAFGWVCATNAKQGLLLGYIWPKSDYPWISLWCSSRNGTPCARGIEFGTTGLHQPFPILVQHPKIFGLPTFEYIDTHESQSRSYATFLLKVPEDFRGASAMSMSHGRITVTEYGGGRQLSVTTGGWNLFQ